jgi:hypothetical protein
MTRALIWVLAAGLAFSASAASQAPPTRRLMRDKLAHAQGVLEALTTSNYDLLQSHAAELIRATELPAWQALKGPEYRRYSGDFLRVAQSLRQRAVDRDLDAAAADFSSLTLACYECHSYMKRARLAKRDGWQAAAKRGLK